MRRQYHRWRSDALPVPLGGVALFNDADAGRMGYADGTILSFRSTVALQPEFFTKVPAGWHFHLDALAEHLAGGARDLAGLDGWESIHEGYVAKLT